MVRITVFTGNDLNSRAVVKALEYRNLDFTEISLVAYPSKLQDLKALIGSVSVPRVFFDTRHVGGVEETMAELRRVDSDPGFRKRISSLNRKSPCEDKLSIPSIPPVDSAEPSPLIPNSIQLPDGTTTTFCDITEKLKNSIPTRDLSKKGVYYKNVFSGSKAIEVFKSALALSPDKAQTFAEALLKAKVFHRVASKKDDGIFYPEDNVYYRLQCHMTPEVLNSYKICTEEVTLTCNRLLDSLDAMLFDIEKDCLDNIGMIDCIKAANHKQFPAFEECASRLQATDPIGDMSHAQRLAFGLNLYRFMLRYAIIKIGIPVFADDRLSFLKRVKFNIGGYVFSFQEFLDGVLRSNRESPFTNPLKTDDPRIKLVIPVFDRRIHFAVNSGSKVGCLSSIPFRKYEGNDLHEQLDMASKVFWGDKSNFQIHPKRNCIMMAKVLDWYRQDFAKRDQDLLIIASKYLTGYQVSKLSGKRTMKIDFTATDWSKNAADFVPYDKDAVKADLKGLKYLKKRFQAATKPANEESRLSVLRSLNILDTLPEERFDRITRMAQNHFNVPIVLVSLVDSERQWFKSSQWAVDDVAAPAETGRDISFCGHAIKQENKDPFVVENSREDDRFADNPFVTGDLKLRFYAGCPLEIPDPQGGNAKIGTLCLLDRRPRDFSEEDESALKSFAAQVEGEIMGRRTSLDSQISSLEGTELGLQPKSEGLGSDLLRRRDPELCI